MSPVYCAERALLLSHGAMGSIMRRMAYDRLHYQFIVRMAPDMPGVWVAHCLDIDVMGHGNSIKEAIDSLVESVQLVIEEGDVSMHHRAPEEDWEILFRVMKNGERAQMQATLDSDYVVAGQLTVSHTAQPPKSSHHFGDVGATWYAQSASLPN